MYETGVLALQKGLETGAGGWSQRTRGFSMGTLGDTAPRERRERT